MRYTVYAHLRGHPMRHTCDATCEADAVRTAYGVMRRVAIERGWMVPHDRTEPVLWRVDCDGMDELRRLFGMFG